MITSRQQFTAAIAALNLSEVTAVMALALDLVHYAPVEVEAYKQANDEYRKGKTKRSKAPPAHAVLTAIDKASKPARGAAWFLADFRALSQHRRDAMTAAWRGMSEAEYLAERNKRTQKSRNAKPAAKPTAKPTASTQTAPAATLIKGKAQSATDSRAIDVAHKILDADYKPTRAELVLLAEALIGDSE